MATGSVRFWFDAWHDLAQVGGGSDESAGDQRTRGGYARPGSRAWHPVDAMPGRERCLRVRP